MYLFVGRLSCLGLLTRLSTSEYFTLVIGYEFGNVSATTAHTWPMFNKHFLGELHIVLVARAGTDDSKYTDDYVHNENTTHTVRTARDQTRSKSLPVPRPNFRSSVVNKRSFLYPMVFLVIFWILEINDIDYCWSTCAQNDVKTRRKSIQQQARSS